jgi:hypothetical protein
MYFVSSLLGLLTPRLSVGLDQYCTARPSRNLNVTSGHPGMTQAQFTWLTHCPLASGDIEINSKCCGLNFSSILIESRWEGRFLEGFLLELLEGFSLQCLEGISLRFLEIFSHSFSGGISLGFLEGFSLGSLEGCSLRFLHRCSLGFSESFSLWRLE